MFWVKKSPCFVCIVYWSNINQTKMKIFSPNLPPMIITKPLISRFEPTKYKKIPKYQKFIKIRNIFSHLAILEGRWIDDKICFLIQNKVSKITAMMPIAIYNRDIMSSFVSGPGLHLCFVQTAETPITIIRLCYGACWHGFQWW